MSRLHTFNNDLSWHLLSCRKEKRIAKNRWAGRFRINRYNTITIGPSITTRATTLLRPFDVIPLSKDVLNILTPISFGACQCLSDTRPIRRDRPLDSIIITTIILLCERGGYCLPSSMPVIGEYSDPFDCDFSFVPSLSSSYISVLVHRMRRLRLLYFCSCPRIDRWSDRVPFSVPSRHSTWW